MIDNYFKLTVRYPSAREQPSNVRGIHPRRRVSAEPFPDEEPRERVVSYCFPFSSESAFQLQAAYTKALAAYDMLGKRRCQITVWDAVSIEHHKLVSAPQIGSRFVQDSGSISN